MTTPSVWTCPNCAIAVHTPFCAACGERPIPPRDLTFRGLAEKLVHAISNIDGKALRTFRRLINHPGDLTVAYLEGRRQPFVAPFQLFLIANVLFFAVQWVTQAKVFSTTLASHLTHQDWSALAGPMVAKRLAEMGTTLERYAPAFDQAVVTNAKTLVILMVLAFAVVLPLVFGGRRRPFMGHVVFALHLYAFLLLMFCLAMGVVAVHVAYGGAGLASEQLDHLLSGVQLAVCTVYIYLAIGVVYSATGVPRVLKATLLAVAVAALVLAYRFVLLPITLFTS